MIQIERITSILLRTFKKLTATLCFDIFIIYCLTGLAQFVKATMNEMHVKRFWIIYILYLNIFKMHLYV